MAVMLNLCVTGQVVDRLLFTGNVSRGVFVNKVHRKPESCGAKSCECMISVHREAHYCERSEQ